VRDQRLRRRAHGPRRRAFDAVAEIGRHRQRQLARRQGVGAVPGRVLGEQARGRGAQRRAALRAARLRRARRAGRAGRLRDGVRGEPHPRPALQRGLALRRTRTALRGLDGPPAGARWRRRPPGRRGRHRRCGAGRRAEAALSGRPGRAAHRRAAQAGFRRGLREGDAHDARLLGLIRDAVRRRRQGGVTATGRVLRARDRALPLGRRTYVMAILNLTDDSFSGDGAGDDLDEAVRRAVRAEADGADIIDVGAESARADVPAREPGFEAALVAEAVRRIRRECSLAVSVDTYKGAVAAGAHGAALVINYTVERPKVRPAAPPRYDDLLGAHRAFFSAAVGRARAAGVRDDAIVLDPGIAFGKSHDEDIDVLRRLPELRGLGYPLLVAASRKHFIASVLRGVPAAERDAATVAVTALAVAGGADIVRVHEVRANVQAARIADAIVRGRTGDYAATPGSWPWAAGATPEPGTRIGEERGERA